MPSRGPNVRQFVLNCIPSVGVETDWSFEDAVQAGVVQDKKPPQSMDLREGWWKISHQGRTGACVGFATADGVLHWHYRKAGLLSGNQRPSPRFIWMANKETDDFNAYPTTFIETAGTKTKLALRIARNYGCVLESTLPMNGRLSPLETPTFYTMAARYRISSYHNIGRDLAKWRSWMANQGPILTRLDVDHTMDECYQERWPPGYLQTQDNSGWSCRLSSGIRSGSFHRAEQLGKRLGR